MSTEFVREMTRRDFVAAAGAMPLVMIAACTDVAGPDGGHEIPDDVANQAMVWLDARI